MTKFIVGDRVRDVSGHYKTYGLDKSPIGTLVSWDDPHWRISWDVDIGAVAWSDDQIELAQDGPVRTETVTRHVIVPGDYQVYAVSRVHETGVNLSVSDGLYDAKALRQFARGLVSMAEVLEQKS